MKVITDGYSHTPLLRAVSADCRPGLQPDLGEPVFIVVTIKKIGRRIVGYICIESPPRSKIRPDNLHTIIPVRIRDASLFGNIRERSVTIVMKEAVTCAFESARAALHIDAAIFAGRFGTECRKVIEPE